MTVRPGQSIQEVINNVSSGAVICLSEGVWRENLQITKNLILRGAGAEKSRIESTGVLDSAISIRGENAKVTVQDVEIWAITIANSAQANFSNVRVLHNLLWAVGMQEEAAQATIEKSKILGGGLVAAILVPGSHQLTVKDSEVAYSASSGITVVGKATARILNNFIHDNKGYGIEADSPDNIVECRGNTFNNNGSGNYNPAAAQKCS